MKFRNFLSFSELKNPANIIEFLLFLGIIFLALYIGFSNPEDLTHPLHGDLILTGNTIYNIHNNIPYEVNGSLQWLDERLYYFYVSPLGFYYAAFFWDNSKDYIQNLILPNMLLLIFLFFMFYFFVRQYFGRNIALLSLLLMSLSTSWYYYMVRSLYIPWVALPAFCIVIYWLFIKFDETGKYYWMVLTGIIAGFGFFFTSWPLLVFIIPLSLAISLFLSSNLSLKQRVISSFFVISIIVSIIFIKEDFFFITQLRYCGDPSGIETFYKIFFEGGYIGRGDEQIFFTDRIFTYIQSRFAVLWSLLFSDFSANGYQLISPIVLITAVPGLILMLRCRYYASRFLAICFILIFVSVLFLIYNSAPRYFLPIFPITYIASAFFITQSYKFIKKYPFTEKMRILSKNRSIMDGANCEKRHHPDKINSFFCIAFICVISFGVLGNIYGTSIYMEKTLPTYSQFEYNCYNSIEWPFPELKAYLKEKQTVYDIIVIPNSFTNQMITYFRLQPGFVHLEGESYGKRVISYDKFRSEINTIKENVNNMKILIIANNFNQMLNDQICPGWENRIPYDKNALTMSEVQELIPEADFVKYVGCKNYPTMLALYETNPSGILMRNISVIPSPWPDLSNEIAPGQAYSSGDYVDETTPIGYYRPEYAFDNNNNTWWHSPLPAGTLGWVVCDLDKPVKISMFSIIIRTDMTDQAPTFFMVSGSSDGKEWTTLGFIEGLLWRKGETKLFSLQNNTQSYEFYRFDFKDSMGDNAFVSVRDMHLFPE